MNILFVSGEVVPFCEEHEQGAAVVTLAKVLRRTSEHKVTIVSPLFGQIDPTANSLARRLTKIEFTLGDRDWACELYAGRNADGTELMFIGNDEVLRSTSSIHASGEPIDARRAGVFSSAVVKVLECDPTAFDIVHGHGWLGAAVIAKIRSATPDIPTILTVYDAQEQGQFSVEDLPILGVDGDSQTSANMMRAGLIAADHVTVLSPNYANRVLASELHNDLNRVFAEIRAKIIPIRHGIDSAVWNPITDPLLPARFDPFNLEGKAKCKADLQHELALPVRSDVPIIAAVGRTSDDRMDLLAEVGPELLRNDVQWVVQLQGDGELVAAFEELWDEWPERICIRTGADPAFLHWLIGASDLVIVPGRAAPTANLQMCAQRYGALPVVHRDGGLADEVVDCEPSLNSGSGFLYDSPTEASLVSALERAIEAFGNADRFQALQTRTMRFDHSWERTARLYERVYDNAISQAARSVA